MLNKEEHVILRALEPEDLEYLYKWENDKAIWNVSNTITPFSKYVLKKYIETSHLDIFETRQLRLMIDVINNLNETRTVGAIDIFDFDPFHLRAGIGVLIGDSSERRKGYAGMALEALIEYCFTTMHLNQLYCNISADNISSIKLFKKFGFTEVGIKKQWIKTFHGYKDELMLQLLSKC